MLKVFKKELNISIITSIIYIILGIVVICDPVATIDIVGKIIAILSIVQGIVIAFIDIKDIEENNSLVLGILSIAMGVILLVYPASLSILISLGLGIWYIGTSVVRFEFVISLKDAETGEKIFMIILSVLTLIIGISFLFTPLSTALALTVISGLMMISYSIIDIAEIIVLKRHIKTIEKKQNNK